jgi:hypothetical protein
MTKFANTVKNTGRAALVAVLLGGSMIPMATPAMAQPNLNFSIDIGGDYQVRQGKRFYKRCLNDRQVIRALRDYGWRDIEITRQLRGDRVEANARWRGDRYSVRVDKCTGEVYDVRRQRGRGDGDNRPGRGGDDNRPGRPGFGLQFEFGN